VLVSEQQPLVERFVRQTDGQWLCTFTEGLSETVDIHAVGCVLELSEIYSRVSFPDVPPATADGR
ncbi:MAG TPA: hypothetical protein VI756_12285, partial [Blastocatellia bacterium]